MSEDTTNLNFDPDQLRARYQAERLKRLREDGNDQYLEVAGEYADFAKDRYEALPDREPLDIEIDALVIGGGFGGLLAGAELKKVGLSDIRIIEKGGRLGGTWYWNQYPGAQCDIESYIYMPLLEELGVMPSERYARAPEILEHVQRIADHYDLSDSAILGTEVTEMHWDDAIRRWRVSTTRNDEILARFVVAAPGPLHRPKLPGVKGIDEFEGRSFHTSRWDYDFTGGGPTGGLDKLGDVRVAVIGTGATGVQVIPHVAHGAQHLYVFQRTPSSIDKRGNAPTDSEWADSLQPGWQKERIRNFNALVSGVPLEVDLVNDGWTTLIGKMMDIFRNGDAEMTGRPVGEILELANFEKMEEIRARVDQTVKDPAVAEALKPYYQMFCKRPCFHDEYLLAYNQDNVTLVDTNGQGIERITPRGVVANGIEYEVDCIIYASGFEVGTAFERRAGMKVYGKDGRTLSEKWGVNGMRTLHGMLSNGYPNYFMLSQSQGAWTANYTQLLEEAAHHMGVIVAHMEANGFETIEPTQESEEAWANEIVASTENAVGGVGGSDCTPGYYNNEGRALEGPAWSSNYAKGSIAFFQVAKAWRSSGDFHGVRFTSLEEA